MSKSKRLPRGIGVETITLKDGTRRTYFRVRVTWKRTKDTLGKQITVGRYDTLTIAKEALEQARVEIIRGEFLPPAEHTRRAKEKLAAELEAGTTVTEWFEKWIDRLENDPLRPRSPATVVSYRSTIKTHVLPAVGHKRLVDVTEADVREIVQNAAKSGVGAAQNVVRHFRPMMNAAIEEGAGGLTKNPVRVKLERATSRHRGDDEIPTIAEVYKIVERMPPHLQLAPQLTAWCQLRAGELLGLQRQDLRDLDDPKKAMLHVVRQWNVKGHDYSEPKSDSVGKAAIPSVLLPAIREHLERYVLDDDEAPVFPSAHNAARPMSYNVLHRAWRDATKGMRYPFVFHSLRHRGSTDYHVSGATPKETGSRSRQQNPDVIARYQHSSEARDREITASMSELIEGAMKPKETDK